MDWLRIIGVCLLMAALVMVLRQMQPQIASLAVVAFSIMIAAAAIPQIHQYIKMVEDFLSSIDLNSSYYQIMLKATGIAVITQMTVQICLDMDAPAVARRAEFCGRLALLGIAVPVFIELAQMAVNMIQ